MRDEFYNNIIKTYGKEGKKWLLDIPLMIEALSKYWGLSSITQVKNMTFNYVLKAMKDHEVPVVVKLSCDNLSMANELAALKHFNSHGTVGIIDYNPNYNALLLNQAIPGVSLKSIYPSKFEYVAGIYIEVMQKLLSQPLSYNHNYKHIKDWLHSIDNIPKSRVPEPLLSRAFLLKNSLLESSKEQYVLHGDLHHDNILQNNNTWLAIDPKGVIGEPEFEIAAFDFLSLQELSDNHNTIKLKANEFTAKELFNSRLDFICRKANFSSKRVADWVFVRLILGAAWAIEDNIDPTRFINIAQKLF